MSMQAYHLAVAETYTPYPGFVRLVLIDQPGAHSLEQFNSGGELGPCDMRVKIIFGGSDRFEALPAGELDHGWWPTWRQIPEEIRGVMRTYTIAGCEYGIPAEADPEIDAKGLVVQRLFVDVALSEHEGVGVAACRALKPGDPVLLIGPKILRPGRREIDGICAETVAGPTHGVEYAPRRTRDVLLVGDETALPAIISILEGEAMLRQNALTNVDVDGTPQNLYGETDFTVPQAVAVATREAELEHGNFARRIHCVIGIRQDAPDIFAKYAEVLGEVQWVQPEEMVLAAARFTRKFCDLPAPAGKAVRTSEPASAKKSNVTSALAANGTTAIEAESDDALIWDVPAEAAPRDFYAWIAGERADVIELRRILRQDLKMPKGSVAFMSYWHRGRAIG